LSIKLIIYLLIIHSSIIHSSVVHSVIIIRRPRLTGAS